VISADIDRYAEAQIKLIQAARDKLADASRGSAPTGDDTPTLESAVLLSLSPAAKAALDHLGGSTSTAASQASEAGVTQDLYALQNDLSAGAQKGYVEAQRVYAEYQKQSAENQKQSAAFSRYGELMYEQAKAYEKVSLVFAARDRLEHNETKYNNLRNKKPVPAVELKGKEKEAVLNLATDLGLPVGVAFDTVAFNHGNLLYVIKKDGTITKNDNNTPTSEAEKQLWLEGYRQDIDLAKTDISDYENTTPARLKESAEQWSIMKDGKSEFDPDSPWNRYSIAAAS